MLEIGKTYNITEPSKGFGDVEFKKITNRYTVLNKEDNLYRMSAYQLELAVSDNYYCVEDNHGCMILLKIKDNYTIEEV